MENSTRSYRRVGHEATGEWGTKLEESENEINGERDEKLTGSGHESYGERSTNHTKSGMLSYRRAWAAKWK